MATDSSNSQSLDSITLPQAEDTYAASMITRVAVSVAFIIKRCKNSFGESKIIIINSFQALIDIYGNYEKTS